MSLLASRISFCDSIEVGQYGKLNIVGYHPFREVIIATLPYKWSTSILVEGITSVPLQAQELCVYCRPDGSPLSANKLLLGYGTSVTSEIPAGQEIAFMTPNFLLPIMDLGKFVISVFLGGQFLTERTFTFALGAAPNIHLDRPLPHSGILGPGSTSLHLPDLINAASRSLTILDQFLKPAELLALLAHNVHSPQVRVLTSVRFRSDYQKATDIPNSVQIRFSRAFHDRFAAINDSEYYHFGHSIKDAEKDRYSRFQKISGADEIRELMEHFGREWEQGDTA